MRLLRVTLPIITKTANNSNVYNNRTDKFIKDENKFMKITYKNILIDEAHKRNAGLRSQNSKEYILLSTIHKVQEVSIK